MAESVDALVSNTSGATHPGSSPGLGTLQPCIDVQCMAVFFSIAGVYIERGKQTTDF